MQGVYQHYKGGYYTVIMEVEDANNKEDRELSVVYVSHTTGKIFVRHTKEFCELVLWKEYGKKLPRFRFVGLERPLVLKEEKTK